MRRLQTNCAPVKHTHNRLSLSATETNKKLKCKTKQQKTCLSKELRQNALTKSGGNAPANAGAPPRHHECKPWSRVIRATQFFTPAHTGQKDEIKGCCALTWMTTANEAGPEKGVVCRRYGTSRWHCNSSFNRSNGTDNYHAVKANN